MKGSEIAKNGYKNEEEVAKKFANWMFDGDALKWLEQMGYKDGVHHINVHVLHGQKSDIELHIKTTSGYKIERIQIKLLSNNTGFNQVDRRWVNKASENWGMSQTVETLFKKFTGEISPQSTDNPQRDRKKRRIFADEFKKTEQNQMIKFLKENKETIINDVIAGFENTSPNWFLICKKTKDKEIYALHSIDNVLSLLVEGEVEISKRGNFNIGKLTLQRKGGDKGKPSANQMQFKVRLDKEFIK